MITEVQMKFDPPKVVQNPCDHLYIAFMSQTFRDGEGRITNQIMKLICSKCLNIVDFEGEGESDQAKEVVDSL